MLRTLLRSLFGATSTAPPRPDAQQVLAAAILELRAVVDGGSAEEITAAIELFKARAVAGDLEPRELADEVADAEHMLVVLAYMDRLNRGEGVQPVATMSDGESAFFHTSRAVRETTRRDDDYGQLDIGERGIFFVGDKRLTIAWRKVLTIGAEARTLIVHPIGGGTPHTFYLRSEREAHLARSVAKILFGQQQAATGVPTVRRKRSATSRRAGSVETAPYDQTLPILDIGSAGSCNFNIVGESSYQGRLRALNAAGRSFRAMLQPEPTNAFDPNAIRVVAEGSDTVGYLSREDAICYQPAFDLLTRHNRVGVCRAQLTGGVGEKRSFGVLLNLRDVDELLMFLRDTLEPGQAAPENVQPF